LFTGNLNDYNSLVDKEQRDLNKNYDSKDTFTSEFFAGIKNIFYKINYHKVTVGLLSGEEYVANYYDPIRYIKDRAGYIEFGTYNIIQYHDMILNTLEKEIKILPYDHIEKLSLHQAYFFTFHWLLKKETNLDDGLNEEFEHVRTKYFN
jgi:hypothetical protein